LPLTHYIENCSDCPNRIDNEYCPLKKCPENAPLRAHLDRCHACDDRDSYAHYAKNCDVCPNRIMVKNKHGAEWCELPAATSDIKAENGKCPADRPLKNWDDFCFSCDATETVPVDSKCNYNQKECESVCPNREIVYQNGGNPPSILKCPAGKPLRDENRICYACDYEWDIGMRWQPENKCETVCPNRFHDNDMCRPKTSKHYKASYECGDVTKLAKQERTICMSEHLGEMDIKMSALYGKVLEKFAGNAAKLAEIKSDQKKWLKNRGGNLLFQYKKHIEKLERILDEN
jgi:uncharacterized protein YecT (DUF1311 family)